MNDAIALEEVETSPASRVYRVRISGEHVSSRVAERLNEIGRSIRLPGFRPGKIPLAILRERYGAKARAELINTLGAEAAGNVVARRELASSVELTVDSTEALEFRMTVTCLAELPSLDFEAIDIERLSGPPSAAKVLDDRLKQNVLDYLDKTYQFPLAPPLIGHELTLIRRATEDTLGGPITAEMDAELQTIAERRVRLGVVVAEMARRHEILPVEEELQRERRADETPAQTRDRLREEKLIRLIVSKAKITDREATEEELRDLAG